MDHRATSYGASIVSPMSSAGVLRATASALKCPLENAGPIHLVAGTIIADIYCIITNRTSIVGVKADSPDEATVITSALLCACGTYEYDPFSLKEVGGFNDKYLDEAYRYTEWAMKFLTDQETIMAIALIMQSLNVEDVRFSDFRDAFSIIYDVMNS